MLIRNERCRINEKDEFGRTARHWGTYDLKKINFLKFIMFI